MKVTAALAASLLAGTALALPSPRLAEKLKQRRSDRLAKRAAGAQRRSLRPLAVDYTSMTDFISSTNDTADVEYGTSSVTYSSNWAGGVVVTTGVTEVTGTFTIPTVSEPSGGSSKTEYGAAAWVGIDGDTCSSAILQTGIEMLVEGTETAYSAWYEWYPNYSYTFDDFDVAPGDVITATVVATSTDSGTATIENVSSGSSVTHTFTNEASEGSLCEYNAEWIVEDFEEGDSLVPFANFGTVTFTDASYKANGDTYGVTDAQIFEVEQNNEVETDVTLVSSSSIKVVYE